MKFNVQLLVRAVKNYEQIANVTKFTKAERDIVDQDIAALKQLVESVIPKEEEKKAVDKAINGAKADLKKSALKAVKSVKQEAKAEVSQPKQ